MSAQVQLRDVEEADLEVFHQQENDPESVRRSKFTPRDRETFMKHWTTKVLGDPGVFVQTVTIDGATAGSIVAWWIQDQRFIGYWLDRRYWGRGVGTEALRLFLGREKTRPLYADPVGTNTGSVRLLEKLGFQQIDTVRHGENEHVLLMLASHTSSANGTQDSRDGA
ncbi:GNAT family N-acetyltransferase [Micromonospora sp. U21]|uniref:GNAT family N-acetyltransferase n=1 Tax=Micromonospora sp. U21 TaxID=2824899 RepID=UPI001B37F4E9|nr:GNAT family N-acetyltransferase [Micromonospora sp. U21]MBQ0906540.1 GNAT family N-acetyltransferase [Micromonospora sp. U21]